MPSGLQSFVISPSPYQPGIMRSTDDLWARDTGRSQESLITIPYHHTCVAATHFDDFRASVRRLKICVIAQLLFCVCLLTIVVGILWYTTPIFSTLREEPRHICVPCFDGQTTFGNPLNEMPPAVDSDERICCSKSENEWRRAINTMIEARLEKSESKGPWRHGTRQAIHLVLRTKKSDTVKSTHWNQEIVNHWHQEIVTDWHEVGTGDTPRYIEIKQRGWYYVYSQMLFEISPSESMKHTVGRFNAKYGKPEDLLHTMVSHPGGGREKFTAASVLNGLVNLRRGDTLFVAVSNQSRVIRREPRLSYIGLFRV